MKYKGFEIIAVAPTRFNEFEINRDGSLGDPQWDEWEETPEEATEINVYELDEDGVRMDCAGTFKTLKEAKDFINQEIKK